MERGKLVALGAPEELIRGLDRELQVEVELLPGDEAAVEALQSLPGVQEMMEERHGLLRVKVTSRRVIPEIAAAVVGVGGRLFRLSPQEPTLEDVYFALHGEKGEG